MLEIEEIKLVVRSRRAGVPGMQGNNEVNAQEPITEPVPPLLTASRQPAANSAPICRSLRRPHDQWRDYFTHGSDHSTVRLPLTLRPS